MAMESHSVKYRIKLGIFILTATAIFILAIFFVGKQKNIFNPVFKLSTSFYNVSGLQVGNNVRFAGINVGTVDNIWILNDSTVFVDMHIRKEIQKFIKSDCIVSMGSEGIIGDRVLAITYGSPDADPVREGQFLLSNEPVETDELLNSLQVTAMNVEILTGQLAEIMMKINNGGGTLGRLIQDTVIAKNLDETISNLKSSSSGLNENMKAARENILLRGYFKRKEREAARKKAEQEKAETTKP